MAERRPHARKAVRTSRAPTSYLFFDTETVPHPCPGLPGTVAQRFRLAVSIYCRVESGAVVTRDVQRHATRAAFWDYVYSRLDKKRPLTLLAHNLLFDFRELGGWRVLEDNARDNWRIILSAPPVIIGGKIRTCPVRFLCSTNYYKMPLKELGDKIGLPKLPMPPFDRPDEDWYTYCTRDVEIVERAILELRSLITDNDLGVMGKTIAQTAMNVYCHSFMPVKDLVHTRQEAIDLERAAHYGGKVWATKVGDFGGPAYKVDCNSLYPFVMQRHHYPRSLVRVQDNPPLEWCLKRAESKAMIARLWIDTTEREYPKRDGRRTDYVVGTFRTALAGEELYAALRSGHVHKVERCCLYDTADLFSEYVRHLYRLRNDMRAAGRPAMAAACKALLNSLHGKFAQQSPRIVTNNAVLPPRSWCKFARWDALNRRWWECQALAGKVQEETDAAEGYNAFPAISACVTAAAREYMRSVQAKAGPFNWLYSDTDSLILNQRGYDNLAAAGLIDSSELGKFKLEQTADGGTIFAPKDYLLGGKRVIAGIPPSAVQVGHNTFEVEKWEDMKGTFSHEGHPDVMVTKCIVHLGREWTRSKVDRDGYVTPHFVHELFDPLG